MDSILDFLRKRTVNHDVHLLQCRVTTLVMSYVKQGTLGVSEAVQVLSSIMSKEEAENLLRNNGCVTKGSPLQ